ncbi:protein BTG2-like [Schistocerca gregaria]|uniref:protein BTG2-like n=1 Tax=Schistocerca gregaria TaxID=7010 RepID=UPI00211F0F0F|nr:protein BTG2-like [Schistocerca gregaria]
MSSFRKNGADFYLGRERLALVPEILAAAAWWANRIEGLSNEQMELFRQNLASALVEKYRGHWDASEPTKGSAYRSILFDEFNCDRVLQAVARNTFISQFECRLPAEAVVMWVDPGAVTVKYLTSNKVKVVYDAEEVQGGPTISAASSETLNCAQEYTIAFQGNVTGQHSMPFQRV